MGLFSRNKKAESNMSSRAQTLAENGGVPLTTEIPSRKPGEKLDRFYEKDSCLVLANTEGLQTGSLLQVRRDGILATVLGKDIAQLESTRHRDRVNDYFDKSGAYSSIEARVVAIEGEHLYCNLGFYVSDK